MRHFLTLHDISTIEIKQLVQRSMQISKQLKTRHVHSALPLKGQTMSMIFQKPSTRTRISAESGWHYYGGQSIFLTNNDIQLGHGESIQDSAKVISSMTSCIFARVGPHVDLETLAKHSSVPVINALTDLFHPLQALADLQTICETFPVEHKIEGEFMIPKIKVAWVGDACNVLNSLLLSMPRLGISMAIATPPGYNPPWFIQSFANLSSNVTWHTSPLEAIKDANVIITDTWISMGQETDKLKKLHDFKGFKITRDMIQKGGANKDWKFMHCLPRKEHEVDDDVFYDKTRSLVWKAAQNRKSSVMAVFEKMMKIKNT